MGPDHPQSIVDLLEELNRQVAKQNALGRMFLVGIIYGIGFFIALGVFGPWFGEIPWIRSAFETGASLLRQ